MYKNQKQAVSTRTLPTASVEGVRDWNDEFSALFPHRYDFIWADHAAVSKTVEWQTERRYPLSDRHLQQGSYLYGVRFGTQTQYAMLDIDIGSPYHPKRDPLAVSRLVSALEPLGLVSYFVCTSSYSGGLHLYLPFEEPQSSWQCAIALSVLLENAGFMVRPGQLELFPNPKPYRNDESFSLFNAHRLPLQIGSYLLGSDFQPIWSDRTTFIQHWQFARSRNTIDSSAIRRVLKQFRRHQFRISGKADKYLNDLNAEIELGWTGAGQTNRLLGRIAMRSYVFHHVINSAKPLTGQALIDEIVRVARSLPGYEDWCAHQHEIEHRAAEWAKCIEASHYFHYGEACGKYKAQSQESRTRSTVQASIEKLPNWNEQQSQCAREKIRNAIADLLNQDSLPATPTQRFKKLLQYKIGGASLYRHKDLWHPQFFNLDLSSITEGEAVAENEPQTVASLFQGNGSNALSDAEFDAAEVADNILLVLFLISITPRTLLLKTWKQAVIQIIQRKPKAVLGQLDVLKLLKLVYAVVISKLRE